MYIVISIHTTKGRVHCISNSDDQVAETKRRWRSCQVLFWAFKDGSFTQQGFLFFFSLQVYLFNLVIGYMWRYPLAQAFPIAAMNILVMLFLVTKRPFKEPLEQIHQITNEIILFTANVSVVVLALFDYTGNDDHWNRKRLGEAIFFASTSFTLASLGFVCLKILITLVKLYKNLKSSNERGLKAFIRLIIAQESDTLYQENAKNQPGSLIPSSTIPIGTMTIINRVKTASESGNERKIGGNSDKL